MFGGPRRGQMAGHPRLPRFDNPFMAGPRGPRPRGMGPMDGPRMFDGPMGPAPMLGRGGGSFGGPVGPRGPGFMDRPGGVRPHFGGPNSMPPGANNMIGGDEDAMFFNSGLNSRQASIAMQARQNSSGRMKLGGDGNIKRLMAGGENDRRKNQIFKKKQAAISAKLAGKKSSDGDEDDSDMDEDLINDEDSDDAIADEDSNDDEFDEEELDDDDDSDQEVSKRKERPEFGRRGGQSRYQLANRPPFSGGPMNQRRSIFDGPSGMMGNLDGQFGGPGSMMTRPGFGMFDNQSPMRRGPGGPLMGGPRGPFDGHPRPPMGPFDGHPRPPMGPFDGQPHPPRGAFDGQPRPFLGNGPTTPFDGPTLPLGIGPYDGPRPRMPMGSAATPLFSPSDTKKGPPVAPPRGPGLLHPPGGGGAFPTPHFQDGGRNTDPNVDFFIALQNYHNGMRPSGNDQGGWDEPVHDYYAGQILTLDGLFRELEPESRNHLYYHQEDAMKTLFKSYCKWMFDYDPKYYWDENPAKKKTAGKSKIVAPWLKGLQSLMNHNTEIIENLDFDQTGWMDMTAFAFPMSKKPPTYVRLPEDINPFILPGTDPAKEQAFGGSTYTGLSFPSLPPASVYFAKKGPKEGVLLPPRNNDPNDTNPGERLYEAINTYVGSPKSLLTPTYCGICDAVFPSVLNAMKHYDSQPHERRVYRWFVDQCYYNELLLEEELERKWVDSTILRFVKALKALKFLTFKCEDCKVVYSSFTMAEKHVTSKLHKSRARGLPIKRYVRKESRAQYENVCHSCKVQFYTTEDAESHIKQDVHVFAVLRLAKARKLFFPGPSGKLPKWYFNIHPDCRKRREYIRKLVDELAKEQPEGDVQFPGMPAELMVSSVKRGGKKKKPGASDSNANYTPLQNAASKFVSGGMLGSQQQDGAATGANQTVLTMDFRQKLNRPSNEVPLSVSSAATSGIYSMGTSVPTQATPMDFTSDQDLGGYGAGVPTSVPQQPLAGFYGTNMPGMDMYGMTTQSYVAPDANYYAQDAYNQTYINKPITIPAALSAGGQVSSAPIQAMRPAQPVVAQPTDDQTILRQSYGLGSLLQSDPTFQQHTADAQGPAITFEFRPPLPPMSLGAALGAAPPPPPPPSVVTKKDRKRELLRAHVANASGPQWTCELCVKRFDDESAYNMHMTSQFHVNRETHAALNVMKSATSGAAPGGGQTDDAEKSRRQMKQWKSMLKTNVNAPANAGAAAAYYQQTAGASGDYQAYMNQWQAAGYNWTDPGAAPVYPQQVAVEYVATPTPGTEYMAQYQQPQPQQGTGGTYG